MHPDKIDPNATEKQKKKAIEKFQELSNSYETLSDPKKRKNYDQFGEDPQRPGQAAENQNAEDIFSAFFGGAFKRGGKGGKGQAQQALYEDEDDVSEMQSMEDYNKILAEAQDYYTEQFVIKFYSGGCKGCHDAKPHFLKVAKAFDKAVNFFAVSCNTHQKVCKKAGVTSYPTVKFFGPKDLAETYKGKLTKADLEKWVSSTMPDKTTRIKTLEEMNKFNADDSQAKAILFVEKPNTPPRIKLMSMTNRVSIGIVSKKEAPKVFKAYKMPAKEQKNMPIFLNLQTGEWSKKSADDIPDYLQEVQKAWREEKATAKYEELDEKMLQSGKCNPSDSKYCLLVVGSDSQSKAYQQLFLQAANDMMKEPVRIFSVHPTNNRALRKKLGPILLKLTDDPSLVLWRPKRRRWKLFDQPFVPLMKSGKGAAAVVSFVRGTIDGGGQLQERHEEL